MKTLFFLMALILIPMTAWAKPFLTCNVYPYTEGVYELVLNDGQVIPVQPLIVTGGSLFYYDTQLIPVGKYIAKVRWRSLWDDVSGWSNECPFTRPDLSGPENIPTGLTLTGKALGQ